MKKKLLLLLVLVGSFGAPAAALTLGDIKVEVRRTIDDRANPGVTYTNAQLVALINQAQRDIVNQTWCLSNRASQGISAGTTYYVLPADLIAIKFVEFRDTSGRVRSLEEVSEKAMRQSNPDYERQAGAPMTYFVRNSTHSAGTRLDIAFLPVPSTTTMTGTAYIDYFNQATDLSSDSDVPFDSDRSLYPYHYALVYLVTTKIKLLEDDPAAATYAQMAQSLLALMMDRLGRAPNYSPSFQAGNK